MIFEAKTIRTSKCVLEKILETKDVLEDFTSKWLPIGLQVRGKVANFSNLVRLFTDTSCQVMGIELGLECYCAGF